ncbi:MAG TPA: hypothetical protein ENJ09_15380 [Planctomycetes bacterium]|nr:hypothetical protein [Planctomycetota bacterium]
MERDPIDGLREALTGLLHELGMRTAFVGQTCDEPAGCARTLVLLRDGELIDNLTYPIAGTPTAHIVEHGACFHSAGVSEMYPQDESLPFFGGESYFGVAVLDPSGRRIGHVGVLDDKPFADPKELETRLRRFANELVDWLAAPALSSGSTTSGKVVSTVHD